MDNKRRKRIESLKVQVTACKENLESLSETLEEICDEERDVNSSLEEYFPNSERYDVSSNALSALESAQEYASEAVDQMESLISELETAME